MSGQPAFRYTGRGYCPVCKTKSDDGLDTHMMCHHLDLGQLWRFPVEWCAVWKGSVRECRDHFNDKHSGSETIDFDQVSKAFPAWTVPRDFWTKALRPEISGIAVDVMLFRESGWKLVHKYGVYRDPLPHPPLREGKISKLILLANRAMVIAKLTQLRIAIPASGSALGEVPLDCYPGTKDVTIRPDTRRVSFAAVDNTIGDLNATSPAEKVETPLADAGVTEPCEGSPVPPPMLFRESGWKLVHKYGVYRDPLPHPPLREGKISKLILLANRAMVIAKLTQLRIAIPASGSALGEVPLDCYPGTKDVTIRPDTRRVSFAAVDNTIGDLNATSPAEKVETPLADAGVTEPCEGSPVPPPGFRPFEWPQADWNTNGDLLRDPGLKFVASWSAKLAEEEMSSPPPLEPMSPLPMADGQESMTVHVAAPEQEPVTPIVVDQIRSVHRRRARKPSSPRTNGGNSASGTDFLFRDILCAEALIKKRPGSVKSNTRDNYLVPRWRLAREGPFPNERSQASLRVLGKGCLFRHTTYEWEDHARPKGGLGVPLNHPRFLEWLGTPDTAWLLEMSPGHWCDTLSRDRALTAAMQLHKDACLMQTNLDILDQYALALHGTAMTLLQRTIGGGSFPGMEVLTGAPGAHARMVSVQMEALGLWRPTMDPLQFAATRS